MLSCVDINTLGVVSQKNLDSIRTGLVTGMVFAWMISGPGFCSFLNIGNANIIFYSAVLAGFLLFIILLASGKTGYIFSMVPWYYPSGAIILILLARLFLINHVFLVVSSFLLGMCIIYLLYEILQVFLLTEEPVYLVGCTLLTCHMVYFVSDIYLSIYPQHNSLISLVLSFSLILFFTSCKNNGKDLTTINENANTSINEVINNPSLKHSLLLLFCFFTVFLIYVQGTLCLSKELTFYNNNWVYVFTYIIYFLAIVLFSFLVRKFSLSYMLGYSLSILGCAVAMGMITLTGTMFGYISLFLFSLCAAGVDMFTILIFVSLSRHKKQIFYAFSGFIMYWLIIESSSFLGFYISKNPAFDNNIISVFIIVYILLAFPLLFIKRKVLIVPDEKIPVEQMATNQETLREEFHSFFKLTATENRVYQLICQGLSNADIADSLQISPNTVKFHVRNILQKAEVKNRRELMALAYNQNANLPV